MFSTYKLLHMFENPQCKMLQNTCKFIATQPYKGPAGRIMNVNVEKDVCKELVGRIARIAEDVCKDSIKQL